MKGTYYIGQILPPKYINEANEAKLWIKPASAALIVTIDSNDDEIMNSFTADTAECGFITQGPFFLGVFKFPAHSDLVYFTYNATANFKKIGYLEFCSTILSISDVDFVFTDHTGVCFDIRRGRLEPNFHESLYGSVGDQGIPANFSRLYSNWVKSLRQKYSPERIWDTAIHHSRLYGRGLPGDDAWKLKYINLPEI